MEDQLMLFYVKERKLHQVVLSQEQKEIFQVIQHLLGKISVLPTPINEDLKIYNQSEVEEGRQDGIRIQNT